VVFILRSLILKLVLLAVSLEALEHVEGPRAVVAADQVAAVLAGVAVVAVLHFLLAHVRYLGGSG